MGNKVSAPAPPNQCGIKQSDVNQATLALQQKQRELDTCNPGQAQARNDAVQQRNTQQSQCAIAGQQLTQLNNDLATRQQQVDNCDPQAALQRRIAKATAENQAFVNAQQQRKNDAINAIKRTMELCDQLVSSSKPLIDYDQDLKDHIKQSTEHLSRGIQTERKYRRQFLDGDPQESTGIAGIRTSDDRVMLAFWITYSFAIIAVALVLINMLGIQDLKQKIAVGALAYALSIGTAYASIVYYG
jgi:hypothetical protein